VAFVGDRLEDYAKQDPDRAALVCGPARLSRQDLVDVLATLERQLGSLCGPGARVVLQLKDPVSLLLSFFACARSDRIAVVMDPDWPARQLAETVADIGPDLVIDANRFHRMTEAAGTFAEAEAGAGGRPCEDRLFYAGFTSGSSGVPKGYVRTHGSWLDSFKLSGHAFGIDPKSRVIIPGRLTHSLHLYGAVCGLACGHEVVLFQRFDPRLVLSALTSPEPGAVLYATPTQLHLLDEAARRSAPLPGVKQVLSSGAKWHRADRQALAEVFPNAGLFEFYGASETSFISVSGPCDEAPEGSVGRAAEGVEIAIGDPQQRAAPGEAGPVWVRSSLLFAGYLSGASSATRWQDGWLTVGDHGFLDKDGFLYLTGRENRMVVTAGLNVYPEEVEAVLNAHGRIEEAVVVGREDRVRGERLEAVVKVKTPGFDVAGELARFCRSRLAAGKVPRVFHVWDHLPLTAGGKPDIQQILAALESGGGEP